MEMLVERKDKNVTVFIPGRIDFLNYRNYYGKINKEINEDDNVFFDFRDVEYISSSGIRILLALKKKVASKGSLKVINATDEVIDIFKATGFDSLIEVEPIKEDLYTYVSTSFKKMLGLKAKYFPDHVYLKNSKDSYTFLDIEKCAQIIAADLSKKGVKKGTHVGIFSNNSINWVLVFFALQKIGGIACLLNNAYNVSELKKVSKIGDITFLCYGETNALSDNFINEVVNVEDSAFIDSYNISNSINFKERLNEYDSVAGLFLNHVEADDICVMIYTSGSTGTPKGVLLSAFNILNSAYSMSFGMELKYNETLCLILPLFHIFGMTAGLSCNIFYNGTIYFPDNIKTSTLLKVIEEEKCTLFHSVPTMVLALINNKDFTKERVSSLRCTILAGAATTKSQLELMQKQFPNNHFVISYGLSEMAPISMTDYEGDFEHLSQTVGIPVSYIYVKICDLATGKECKNGEQGEILASGYSTFSGYYKVDLEKQAIDDGGWIHTGDLGFLDDDGYIHLTGRAKELIIRGGENIVPNEVAGEISKHPAISDVKVVGVPDDFFGEVVCACLLLKEGETFDKEAMNLFLSDKLAKYKIPAHYAVYDKFPMLASGKVDMVNLKKDAINKCKGE